MEYCTKVLQRPPHVFVDYHGHSRRKNVFLFGCSRSGSWSAADRAKPDQPVQYLVREDERGRVIHPRVLFPISPLILHLLGSDVRHSSSFQCARAISRFFFILADVTAPHAEDLAGVRSAAMLLQGREEQGIHRPGRRVEAAGCFEVNDGHILGSDL